MTAPKDKPRTSCFWLIQPKIRIQLEIQLTPKLDAYVQRLMKRPVLAKLFALMPQPEPAH